MNQIKEALEKLDLQQLGQYMDLTAAKCFWTQGRPINTSNHSNDEKIRKVISEIQYRSKLDNTL